MKNKTQGINFTLYQRHIDTLDVVSRDVLDDPRHNRSRALQHIIDVYALHNLAGRRNRQPPAASDRGGKGENDVGE